MASRRSVRYAQLANDDDDGGDYYDGSRSGRFDPRFEYSPKGYDRIPWKSIALALFLLCLGSLLLFLSLFILSGHMGGEKSQAYGLLVLGILTFLPASPLFWWLSYRTCMMVTLPFVVFHTLAAKDYLGNKMEPFLCHGTLKHAPTFLRIVGYYFYDSEAPRPGGFYETRIAYYSWRGANGYRFASIPDY